MIMYFTRLFYGMIVEEKEILEIQEIFKEQHDVLIQNQIQLNIDMVYDFSSNIVFFIYIVSSLQKIDGNGIQEVEFMKKSVFWDNVIYNFCDLFNLTYNKPGWYLTNEAWN